MRNSLKMLWESLKVAGKFLKLFSKILIQFWCKRIIVNISTKILRI